MSIDVLSDKFYEEMRTRAKKRVGQKRFAHVESVANTAVLIAKTYDVDWRKARLAAILHDWDKDIPDDEIRLRAQELGVKTLPYVTETMPKLLHGLTAAAALAQEYPEIPNDILDAISCHTSGREDMTDLEMVVYIADVIEPLRPYPVTEKLRENIGKVSLEDLFVSTLKQVFLNLVGNDYRIHPSTIDVWNYYMARTNKRASQKKKGN